jgi:hypothetical protein
MATTSDKKLVHRKTQVKIRYTSKCRTVKTGMLEREKVKSTKNERAHEIAWVVIMVLEMKGIS